MQKLIAVAAAIVMAGCGAASPTSPSQIVSVPVSVSDNPGMFHVFEQAVCPDGDRPAWVRAEMGHSSVDLYWAPVDNVDEYQVRFLYYTSTNIWVPVAGDTVTGTHKSWLPPGDGRYFAIVRTHNRCNIDGPWTLDQDRAHFSTDEVGSPPGLPPDTGDHQDHVIGIPPGAIGIEATHE